MKRLNRRRGAINNPKRFQNGTLYNEPYIKSLEAEECRYAGKF